MCLTEKHAALGLGSQPVYTEMMESVHKLTAEEVTGIREPYLGLGLGVTGIREPDLGPDLGLGLG